MRLKGEIVFPNNIRQLRLRKRLTQAQLGRLMEPPLGESTISKMESGERRLTNLQLANLAALLGCPPEAIPVVATRDPATGVREWQQVQEEAVRHTIESGAAAIGYVLAVLRKKSGVTMQQVANAIGMTLSVYHRLEMASRSIQPNEIEAIAKFYRLTPDKLIGMFERRTLDNRAQLENGVPAEQLLPRTPRSLLKDDTKWGRLGALERCVMRRSIRVVAPASRADNVASIRQDDQWRRWPPPLCHRSPGHGGPNTDRRLGLCRPAIIHCSKLLAPSWFAVKAWRTCLCRSANPGHHRRYRVCRTPVRSRGRGNRHK